MRENVGKRDQVIRSIVGPALIGLGYTYFRGRNGKLGGLATIILGTLIIESAVTRTCPANALIGVDTRKFDKEDEELGMNLVH